ncbi:MAG: M56 family metallopeptidase [Coriobacteriia bacterium]|nr:M56 family metallopeptidase [Coriobacteriia bacterium]
MAVSFLSFLATSFALSVVIVAILAFRTYFPKLLRPQMRFVLWIVILVGLVIPFRPLLGDGIINVQLPFVLTAESSVAAGSANAAGAQSINAAASADFGVGAQSLPVQDALTSSTSVTSAAALSGTSSATTGGMYTFAALELLAVVWAVIALVVLSYHLWKYFSFLRLVRRWSNPVDDTSTLAILDEVKAERGMNIRGKRGKRITLRRCDLISTSMIVGFLRPTILLPDKDFTPEELEMIFHHELIHCQRGDLYVKLLSVIALSLHWFNPAVYAMNAALLADCEAACDQAVIKQVGSNRRQIYVETIMEMVGPARAGKVALASCFCDDKSKLKTRMEAIMNATDSNKKIAIATLGMSLFTFILVVILVVGAGSVFAFAGQDQAESTASTDITATDNSEAIIFDDDFFAPDTGPDDWPYNHPYFGDRFPYADPRTGQRFIQPEGFWGGDKTLQLEDGTLRQMSLHEDLEIRMHEWIKITEVQDNPSSINISYADAYRIARQDLASRNITTTGHTQQALRIMGLDDFGWQFAPDGANQWAWMLWFRLDPSLVTDADPMPFIYYAIDIEDGSILQFMRTD